MTALVLRQDAAGVCTLTLNRPDKLNALNTALFMELEAQLAQLETEADTTGCVLLRGAGRAFCVGADLAALAQGVTVPTPMYKTRVIERLATLPQPVVAAVHGHCFTGGLELALAADFILAASDATFADTHGKWGLVAGWGMTQRLPRRIGTAQAKRMAMTGRVLTAADAQRLGLVDDVAADGDAAFQAMVADWAAAITGNSWHTNRHTKRLMRETEGMALAAGLAHEFFHHPGAAPDFAERVGRFQRKG